MLDRDAILNSGNKPILNKFDEISKNLTKDNAGEYLNMYSGLPTSQLLDISYYIFREPYYGLDFYINIWRTKCIPLHRRTPEWDKFSTYVVTNIINMPESQQKKYSDAYAKIKDSYHSYAQCTAMSDMELISKIPDKVYDNPDGDLLPELSLQRIVPYLYILTYRTSTPIYITKDLINYIKSLDDEKEFLIACTNLRHALKDTGIWCGIEHMHSQNLEIELSELANYTPKDFWNDAVTEVQETKPIYNVETVMAMMEAEEAISELTKEADNADKINNLMRQKDLIEVELSDANIDVEAYSNNEIGKALTDAVTTLISIESSTEDDVRLALAEKRVETLSEAYAKTVSELEALGVPIAESEEELDPFV